MDLKAQILAELDANLQKLGESFGQYMDQLVSDRTITLGEAKDEDDMDDEDMDDEDMDDEDMDDEDMDDEDMDDEDMDEAKKTKKSKAE